MSRPVKWLIPALTVLVVFGADELHSRFVAPHPYSLTQQPRFGWICGYIVIVWITGYAAGLPDAPGSRSRQVIRAVAALGSAAVLVSLLQLVSGTPLLPRFVIFLASVVLVPLDALVADVFVAADRRRGGQDRVVAVVSAPEAERLVQELGRAPERPVRLVAVVAPEEVSGGEAHSEKLGELVREHRATLVVLDRVAQGSEEIVAQAAALHSHGTRIRTLSLFYDEWLGKLPVGELERISLMFDINEIHRPIYARAKRSIDIAISLFGVAVLVVLIPGVAIANLFGNRGPLFFRQQRVGKDGEVFTILKFRTMAPSDSPAVWTKENDSRVGTVGRLLRRSHLDEVPQVLNVLRRDLSVVGPRPEQPQYVASLSASIPFYDFRHLVKPGITGWAQVKYDYGASELDAIEKLQYEFFYLRHQSLGLDLRILGRTLRSIVAHGR